MISDGTIAVAPERRQRVEEIFARIDSNDPECLHPFLNEGAQVIFGNQPPLVGKDQVLEGVTGFYSMIDGLSHKILGIWESDGATTVKLEVTYTRKDGGQVTIPVITLMEEDDDGIERYGVYFDMAPVFA